MHQNGLIFDAVAFGHVVDFLEINYFCDEKLWHSITNGKTTLELLLLIARSLVLERINFDALMQNGVNQHSWIWKLSNGVVSWEGRAIKPTKKRKHVK